MTMEKVIHDMRFAVEAARLQREPKFAVDVGRSMLVDEGLVLLNAVYDFKLKPMKGLKNTRYLVATKKMP